MLFWTVCFLEYMCHLNGYVTVNTVLLCSLFILHLVLLSEPGPCSNSLGSGVPQKGSMQPCPACAPACLWGCSPCWMFFTEASKTTWHVSRLWLRIGLRWKIALFPQTHTNRGNSFFCVKKQIIVHQYNCLIKCMGFLVNLLEAYEILGWDCNNLQVW